MIFSEDMESLGTQILQLMLKKVYTVAKSETEAKQTGSFGSIRKAKTSKMAVKSTIYHYLTSYS